MGLLDWVREFKKHYKSHTVDYEVTDSGTKVTITIELKDIPEERAREIIAKLDGAIEALSRGKLPLPVPASSVREKIERIKEKVKPKPKPINPLVSGVVANA